MWGRVSLEAPELAVEPLLALAAAGSLGVEIVAVRPGVSRVAIYDASLDASRARAQRVAAAVDRLGLDRECSAVESEGVADGHWVERYQAALQPFDLGRGFRVDPAGRGVEPGPRVQLALVPGRAFGTGEHATTQLCVEALECWVRPGSSWLDLGCGTALLALVAHHLGAARVRGVDCDDEAVAVAREVVAANGLSGRIAIERGDAGDQPAAAWDGVVANIDLPYLSGAGAALARLLRRGGMAIVSGFLGDDAAGLERSLGKSRLQAVERSGREGWTVIVARLAEPA